MKEGDSQRESFKSSFGFLFVLIGSAIGLGNLWRFPYLAGNNGGAAFILIYLLSIAFICLPIFIGEYAVGRRSRANSYRTFKKLAPNSKWHLLGLLGVITAFIIFGFYSVVGGWTLNYLGRALFQGFSMVDGAELRATFNGMTASPVTCSLFTLLFMVIATVIVWGGVQNGIEKSNKVIVGALIFIIIVLPIISLNLPGAKEGVAFLLRPDFSKVTFHTVLDAVGQGLFSLNVGCCCILTMASYSNKQDNLLKIASVSAGSDTVFALLAGFAILPAIFSCGLTPDQGPGLAFISLPYVFSRMPAGRIFSILFYLTLFFASLSSAISMVEIVASYIKDEFKTSRGKAVGIIFCIAIILGILCALSFNVLDFIKILGKSIFELCDTLSCNFFMMIGALLLSLFVGWKIPFSEFQDEITSGGKYRIPRGLVLFLHFLLKFVSPIAVILIMISTLIEL